MDDYLSFRKMITPILIQILFWILLVVSVLAGLFDIFRGATADIGGGALVLRGIVLLVLGPIFIRVYTELLIILFRMNKTLTEIQEQLKKKK